jgi:DNA-binding MarR family transcriptional regulator
LKIEREGVQHLSSKMQQQQIIEWRRAKVMELLSKGESSQSEIARILQVDKSIISRDIQYLRQQSKENIKRYVDERLPEEYEKCLVGLTAILREAWNTSQQAEDRREKIQALSLAKDCYSMKMDLLTNATVVDDAIKFVSEKSKDKVKDQVKSSSSSPSDSSNEDNKEPRSCTILFPASVGIFASIRNLLVHDYAFKKII